MANFKRIPVLIDAATGKQIDEFGAVVRDRDYFRLLFDETVVLCCQFYDVEWNDGVAQLTPRAIDPDLTLAAFGDSDFDPLTSFMFLSEQTENAENDVNIVGDWLDGTSADPANGQLSFRVDTNTVRFAAVLESSSSVQKFYFCIIGVPSGQTAKSVLAYFRFKAENRPSSTVGAPASSDPEYLNAQEVQALVKLAPDFEFSLDGATLWHTPQVSTDHFYREQRNGGEWSEAIELIVGAQGIQGLQGIQGVQGDQGIQGPQGAEGANGTGVAPRGIYAAGTTYALNEGVSSAGTYYRSLADNNTGNQPDTSPEWEIMISGDNSSGDVIGPVSASDSAVALFDGTSGKLLKDGPAIGTSANNIVQLDGTAKLPAVDGSQLTNLPSSSGGYLDDPATISANDYGLAPVANSISLGNDATTQFLLQNSIADSAAGAGTPASIVNDGVTVDGNGDLIFDGASKLTVDYTSGGLLNAWGTNTEWTLDFDITLTNGAVMWCKMSGVWVGILGVEGNSTPSVWLGGEGSTIPVSSTVKTTITIENWLDGATWTSTYYKNGVVQETRLNANWGPITDDFIIGRRDNFMTGKLNRIRLSNVGLHQGQAFTLQAEDYTAGSPSWSIPYTEQTSPSLTTKLSGRNVSNEPIEISTANNRKNVIYDLDNTSGGASINYTTNPATLYKATATAAVTGWTFTNFPTNFPFKLHVTGNFDITYGTNGTGSTANQDGLKVFDVEYDGTNYQMTFANSTGGGASVATVNAQTGTSYTLVLGNANNIVTMNNASLNTLTIPLNASVAYPVGTIIAIDQIGAGVTTVEGDTGVTVNGVSGGSNIIATRYLGVSIKKLATDTWILQGGI